MKAVEAWWVPDDVLLPWSDGEEGLHLEMYDVNIFGYKSLYK